ncbi:MAG TPA: hypothetical protein VFP20_11610 [Bacteroidales bacterium]|nr:hypothetical protein [Bacteroidales bacterium]
MKKIFFGIILMFGAVLIASAQEDMKVLKVDTLKPAQNLCKAVPLSHWSVAVKGGLNNYLMAPPAPTYMDRLNLTLGGVIEYTFNPLFGIGLEYDFSDYSRPYTYRNTPGDVKGSTNDILLFESVNLSNAFAPFRQGMWTKLNFYGTVGAGVAMYNGALDGATEADQTSLVGMLGLIAELNLSKAVSLSLEGKYHQYDALNLVTGARSNRNGDALMLVAGLRFKLGSKLHARNASVRALSPEPKPIIVLKTIQKGDTEAVTVRLKTAENLNVILKDKLNKLQQDAQNSN